MRTRTSVRVVLADEHDRILLARVVDAGTVGVPGETSAPVTYWVTPGGGVEPGETLESTAYREMFEETGITAFTLGPHLLERPVEFVLQGEAVRCVEHYYSGWVDGAVTSLDHLDPHEQDEIVEHRWWTLEEITDAAQPHTIFPPNIGHLARKAIANRRAI